MNVAYTNLAKKKKKKKKKTELRDCGDELGSSGAVDRS